MKTKLIICMTTFFMLLGTKVSAQNEGIRFLENKTFSEALQLAKENDKLLFVDCYTSWCGPCRMMSNKVFTQKQIGDYFNAEFINIKVDMEKGEGPELHKRFNVRAYPTFLFIDGNGNEVNRIVGGSEADKFLASVKEGISSKSMKAMTERYEAGERSQEFLTDYLNVLEKAYASDECERVAAELLNGREEQLLENETLYNVFLNYTLSPLTPAFQHVLAHKADFETKYDAQQLNTMLDMTWKAYPRNFVKADVNGNVTFDEKAMKDYIKEMKRCKVKERGEIILLTDIYVAESTKDWKNFAKYCSRYIKKFGENDMYIYNWSLRIIRNCTDKEVKETAAKWMKDRIKHIEEEEARQAPLAEGEIRAMPMVNFKKAYEENIEKLTQKAE